MIYHIFFIIAAVCIGTIGLFVKLSSGMVHPMVLGFYRVLFGFILLAIVSPIIDKNTFKIKGKNLKRDALIGFLFAFNFTATSVAYIYAPIQNVSLILSMTPVFVLIFAYFILKEKITKTKIITLTIALIGLFILNPLRTEGFWGNILAVIVVISGGFMFTLLRKVNKDESIGNITWFFLFATIFTLPMPFIFGFGKISWSVVSLGVISSGAAYLFYNLGFEKVEAEIGSLITNILAPIAALFFAFTIIGETANNQVLIGGALLVIAGLYLKTHNHGSKTIKHT